MYAASAAAISIIDHSASFGQRLELVLGDRAEQRRGPRRGARLRPVPGSSSRGRRHACRAFVAELQHGEQVAETARAPIRGTAAATRCRTTRCAAASLRPSSARFVTSRSASCRSPASPVRQAAHRGHRVGDDGQVVARAQREQLGERSRRRRPGRPLRSRRQPIGDSAKQRSTTSDVVRELPTASAISARRGSRKCGAHVASKCRRCTSIRVRRSPLRSRTRAPRRRAARRDRRRRCRASRSRAGRASSALSRVGLGRGGRGLEQLHPLRPFERQARRPRGRPTGRALDEEVVSSASRARCRSRLAASRPPPAHRRGAARRPSRTSSRPRRGGSVVASQAMRNQRLAAAGSWRAIVGFARPRPRTRRSSRARLGARRVPPVRCDQLRRLAERFVLDRDAPVHFGEPRSSSSVSASARRVTSWANVKFRSPIGRRTCASTRRG